MKPAQDEYARPVIRSLQRAKGLTANPNVAEAIDRALRFLNRRLTDAAKVGCHHCHERPTEPGSPCWWCGLKNRKRP